MTSYRWATLGCGVIGNELAQAMQQLGGNLYGVGNRTHAKAVSFAEKYGISKVYDKPEDIFPTPTSISSTYRRRTTRTSST